MPCPCLFWFLAEQLPENASFRRFIRAECLFKCLWPRYSELQWAAPVCAGIKHLWLWSAKNRASSSSSSSCLCCSRASSCMYWFLNAAEMAIWIVCLRRAEQSLPHPPEPVICDNYPHTEENMHYRAAGLWQNKKKSFLWIEVIASLLELHISNLQIYLTNGLLFPVNAISLLPILALIQMHMNWHLL